MGTLASKKSLVRLAPGALDKLTKTNQNWFKNFYVFQQLETCYERLNAIPLTKENQTGIIFQELEQLTSLINNLVTIQ